MIQWKQFNFFDVSQVKAAESSESASVFESNEISCVCSGSDTVFLGSSDGFVRILSQAFKVVRSFRAHDTGSITQMKQIEGTSLLVTVSEDLSSEPVLKVWALDKTEKKTGAPRCQSTLSIHNGRKQFPISAFAALEDLSQLAVGFANGSVTVIRGDLIHDRGAKQRIVFESEEPITGVAFREGAKLTTLYLSTTGRILTLVISGKGQGQPARLLEDMGCGVDCMTVDKRNGDIVVIRDDAIYYYGLHGRGPCYAYDGPKKLVYLHRSYIALVSPSQSSSISKPNPLRRLGASQAEDLFNTSNLTLLDTDLQFVAHSEGLISPVKALFSEWGDLFVLTLDGKTLQQKLDLLYQRNLYVPAITLARKAGVDASQQNNIFRRYGDHLYQKGDFDGAMQQYLRAINNTEPSQVIRKFLDTQRIHNLIEYLEELHEQHKANADHTTLLLNCYAKLKDIDKLEKFIKSPGDLKFDLDTAISMCRQGGYYHQAAYLGTKHGEHDLVVTILVEDSKQYPEALHYIWRLEPDIAHRNLMRYARVLLEHCPNDTTQLFIDYFTGQYRPKTDIIASEAISPQTRGASAMQNLAALLPLPYMNTSGIASPRTPGVANGAAAEEQITDPTDSDLAPKYDPPQPRTAFSSFVDHADEFIVFLEACLDEEMIKEEDKIDLYTTLFEMYLHNASLKAGSERVSWEAKAKKLIESRDVGIYHSTPKRNVLTRSQIPIDTSNVLLLSHLSDFRDGTILVREKQGLRFDIFRSYTSANDTAGVIKALRKYGPDEPQLYPAALVYFTSSPRILKEAGDELHAVLKKIDDDGLMAPLQVIQTLSTNAVATMGMVRKYLSATIEREKKEISNVRLPGKKLRCISLQNSQNRRLIEDYRSETEAKRQEIEALGNKPAVFQATRCSACGGNLDLPTIHFLCKHSFHQRCLNQTDTDEAECPKCASNNATVRAIRTAQDETADRHDMFQDALQRSTDRFGTISEYFGRGVMSAPTVD
ncbi:MAG: hypothetical protein M1837_006266 [Sclerophora amabilis]|nr:MAG: hypothetical protein M1837_006266 [Sclerophora amabilis]